MGRETDGITTVDELETNLKGEERHKLGGVDEGFVLIEELLKVEKREKYLRTRIQRIFSNILIRCSLKSISNGKYDVFLEETRHEEYDIEHLKTLLRYNFNITNEEIRAIIMPCLTLVTDEKVVFRPVRSNNAQLQSAGNCNS